MNPNTEEMPSGKQIRIDLFYHLYDLKKKMCLFVCFYIHVTVKTTVKSKHGSEI